MSQQMWRSGCMEQWMPTVAMVATNIVIAVMTALIKKALDQGLNRLVLITFRQMLATVFLGPIAYCKERKNRPKFTAEIFAYMFLNGILGPVLLQYTLFVGLEYTTATFAATFSNMVPVVTFLISVAFRIEAVDVRSKSGSAKISGTLVSLSGAMLLTFYKGAELTHTSIKPLLRADHRQVVEHSKVRWVLGSIAMLANVVGFALWLLLQKKFTKKYPAIYSSTAFMSLFSFLQAGALTLSAQRSISVWALKGKIEIIAVLYCGIVASGTGYLLLTWCVEKRGPVFTATFSPLSQIFVAGIDLFILHEPLYLGSVLGSVLVILGLYLVLWGKKEEVAVAPTKPAEEDVEQQVK